MRNAAKTQFARSLRKKLTDAETRIWFHLRRKQLNGWRFRKQHPIGPYIVDFDCLEAGVVIEIDGSQHLDSDRDTARDALVRRAGFRVLRFWNHDMLARTEIVLAAVVEALDAASRFNNCDADSSVLRNQRADSVGKRDVDTNGAIFQGSDPVRAMKSPNSTMRKLRGKVLSGTAH